MRCWAVDRCPARERARRCEHSGTVGTGTDVGPARGVRSRAAQAHRGTAHGHRDRTHPRRPGRPAGAGAPVGRRRHGGDGVDLRDPREAAQPAGRHARARAAGGAGLGVAGRAAAPTGRRRGPVLRRAHLLRGLRPPLRRPRHRAGPDRLPDLLPVPVRARDRFRAARLVRGHRCGVRLQRRSAVPAAAADPGGHPGPAAAGLPGPARAADRRPGPVAGRRPRRRGQGPGGPAHRHRPAARERADDPGAAGGRHLRRGGGPAAAAPCRRRRDRSRAARPAAAHRAQRGADRHPHPASAGRLAALRRGAAGAGRGDGGAAPGPAGAAAADAAAGR